MTCLAAITFGVVCALNAPNGPEPQSFAHGKATNRAVYAGFTPYLPAIGPVVSVRPRTPPQEPKERDGLGLAALTAYAPERASESPFDAIRGGFKIAHQGVDTSCFPSQLVRILRDTEKRFGRKVIVTSGYRSPRHNKRVRGARHSQHMNCKAADIRVPGVSKDKLYAYLLRHPKRGGVGIYGSQWVHIDVARQRTWDWRRKSK